MEAPKGTNAIIQVYFSPNGSCIEAVVETLGRAKTTVKLPAYSFTSVPARIELLTHRGSLPPMGFPPVVGLEVTRAQLR